MRLLEFEAQIVSAVGLQADASVEEIARLVGARPHKCRYALDKLFERGVIKRRVVINPARLGYQCYGLWFATPPTIAKQQLSFITALTASHQVSYLGEYSGEYRWRMDILARSAKEADAAIGVFTEKYGAIFSSRSFFCTLSIRDYSFNALTKQTCRRPAICVDFGCERIDVSAQDQAILRELAANSGLSQSMLARKLKMPLATLSFRMNRLKEKEVILGSHMLVEADHVRDYEVTLQLHRLRFCRRDDASLKRLMDFASQDGAVHGLTTCLGDIDAEVCSVSPSPRGEREFDHRLNTSLGDLISSVSTLAVIKHHKVNSFPFG